MQKLSIKKIIEFRTKSDNAKKSLVSRLQLDKPKRDEENGGDYWITCLSSIAKSFKTNELQAIKDKKIELIKKKQETEYERTRIMFGRNSNILSAYEDQDFSKIRPAKKIQFLKKNKSDFVLTVKGFQIQVRPHHVFAFGKDQDEVGAIWFIAKLGGLQREELGMFTDTLFRYLGKHFSRKYNISARYCLAVDVINKTELSYLQLQQNNSPMLLDITLDEIKKLL